MLKNTSSVSAVCSLLVRQLRLFLTTATMFNFQWRRSVVKSGGQGQSGQAIKLFQITPYVNDFQTLCFSQLSRFLTACIGASKNQFYLPLFSTQVFHPWWCETCSCRVIQQQFQWKSVNFSGSKLTLTPATYFQGPGVKTPNSQNPRLYFCRRS